MSEKSAKKKSAKKKSAKKKSAKKQVQGESKEPLHLAGLLVSQRESESAPSLFVFAARASKIRLWAGIQRTFEKPKAAQRMLSRTHVKAIKNYVNASADNVVPTAVTIALPSNAYEIVEDTALPGDSGFARLARLRIQAPAATGEEEKPGIIIDGQHRLFALAELCDEAEDVPVIGCVILGADLLECALQFVVINNTAKRIPTDLVKAILAELGPEAEETFLDRLQRVGITLGRFQSALRLLDQRDDSPFLGRLDWPINRDGVRRVKPAALEAALRTILAELDSPSGKPTVDEAVLLLCAIWTGIRDAWSVADVVWDDPSSKLVSKAGLVAATEFVVERLNVRAEEGIDVSDWDVVHDESKRMFGRVPGEFWLFPWSQKGLDTSAGRGLIRNALSRVRRQASREGTDPFDGVMLIASRAQEADSDSEDLD